jgi:hypothetical protein
MNHTEHANYRSAALADLILGRIGDGTDFVADERVTFEQVPLLAEQQSLKSNLQIDSYTVLPNETHAHPGRETALSSAPRPGGPGMDNAGAPCCDLPGLGGE